LSLDKHISDFQTGVLCSRVFDHTGHYRTDKIGVQAILTPQSRRDIGNLKPKVDLPLQEVVSRQLTLLGSCASSGEYPECIDLLASGAVDVRPLISLTAPLEDGPGLFERLHRGGEGLMKVVLQP